MGTLGLRCVPVPTPKRTPLKTADIVRAPKDDLVRLRIPAAQKVVLTEAAARQGLDLSNWARRVLYREAGILPEAK